MSQWWVNEGGHPGILSGSNYGSGGGNTAASGAVQFRSPIDQARAAGGKLPQAEYPDGYLGNIIDRRSDRLIQHVQNRLTEQSYQRGVHKGSRIESKNYLWPNGGVTPDAGLMRESRAERVGNVILTPRFAPIGNPVERLAHQGRTSGMATPGELGRKMEEARNAGVDPSMNPIIPMDPKHFMPRYRTA
jgi:hypothetical protein